MKTLEQELKELKEALKRGDISVNEYSTMYLHTYKKYNKQ